MAEPSTVVLYFGGYLSTQKDMDAWLASAREQAGKQFSFEAFHYPTSATDQDASAVKFFGSAKISELAKRITDDKTRQYVIVGHSSGCAISNAVAEKAVELQGGKAKNFRLVALDGFRPRKDLFAKMDITCWSAKNGQHKSRNWDPMVAAAKFRSYDACNCGSQPWCLHFSLVNENATADTVQRIAQGYANCKANLEWLK
jgi:hypothetical protein